MTGSCTEEGAIVKVFESIFAYSNFMQTYEKKENVTELLKNFEMLMTDSKKNASCSEQFTYLNLNIYDNFRKSYLQSATISTTEMTSPTLKIGDSQTESTGSVDDSSINSNQFDENAFDFSNFSLPDINAIIFEVTKTTEKIETFIAIIFFNGICLIFIFIYLTFFKN